MSYSPSFFNSTALGTAKGTASNFQNGSGSTLAKGLLVSLNTSSLLVQTLPTSETLVQAIVGMTNLSLPNGASGAVIDNGRLENITTSFAFGDALYLNRDGSLTNVKPDIGDANGFTEGDFVIFIGVVAKNEFNGSLKDLKLMISVIGQL